jgi:hypothetical protein
MDAAATPLPREETTPPVTKIYFGPLCKALESLRWSRRTSNYGGNAGGCQFYKRRKFLSKLEIFRQTGFGTREMRAGREVRAQVLAAGTVA